MCAHTSACTINSFFFFCGRTAPIDSTYLTTVEIRCYVKKEQKNVIVTTTAASSWEGGRDVDKFRSVCVRSVAGQAVLLLAHKLLAGQPDVARAFALRAEV